MKFHHFSKLGMRNKVFLWMKDRWTRGGWREEDTELSAVINSEDIEHEPHRSVV